MTPTHERYRRAARRVERGWCRRRYSRGDKVCLVQSLFETDLEVHGGPASLWDVCEPIHAMLCERDRSYQQALDPCVRPNVPPSVIKWNDKFGRRKHEVVELLDAVADRLELKYLREQVSQLEYENQRLRDRLTGLVLTNPELTRDLLVINEAQLAEHRERLVTLQ